MTSITIYDISLAVPAEAPYMTLSLPEPPARAWVVLRCPLCGARAIPATVRVKQKGRTMTWHPKHAIGACDQCVVVLQVGPGHMTARVIDLI